MTASLTAPEVAVLRSAAVLAASGIPATDRLVVAHALGARGVQINTANAARYAVHLDGLIRAGLIAIDDDTAELDGTTAVIITRAGRKALDEQDGRS